jgi:hypothetical protein
MEDEDVHHALIRCTLATALREEMRTVWPLPTDAAFKVTGKEWLLHLSFNSYPLTCDHMSYFYYGGCGIIAIT